jgi:membrane protein implicated in regulation of membrane protease activity
MKPRRTVTTLAVGFLALDAVLFVLAAVITGRWPYAVGGGLCALAAVLVVRAWRRYRRTLAELERARQEMRAEIESIRDLLHTHHLNN